MRNIISRLKLVIIIFIIILQSGCSIIPPPTTVQNYQLPLKKQVVYCNSPVLNATLQVEQPLTNQLLDTSHIIVHTKNNAIAIYKGARWNDTTPAILRDYLVQSLQQSGCLQTVTSDIHNLNSQLTLTGSLYAFQGEYSSDKGEVWIHYSAYLIDSQTRSIIASKDFNIREPIAKNDIEGTIIAFGIAADRLSVQMVQWISQQKLPKPD